MTEDEFVVPKIQEYIDIYMCVLPVCTLSTAIKRNTTEFMQFESSFKNYFLITRITFNLPNLE